jgi:hypothetical protein
VLRHSLKEIAPHTGHPALDVDVQQILPSTAHWYVPAGGGAGGVFGHTVCAGCGSAQMPAAGQFVAPSSNQCFGGYFHATGFAVCTAAFAYRQWSLTADAACHLQDMHRPGQLLRMPHRAAHNLPCAPARKITAIRHVADNNSVAVYCILGTAAAPEFHMFLSQQHPGSAIAGL